MEEAHRVMMIRYATRMGHVETRPHLRRTLCGRVWPRFRVWSGTFSSHVGGDIPEGLIRLNPEKNNKNNMDLLLCPLTTCMESSGSLVCYHLAAGGRVGRLKQ
ncbi:hypothetical protein PAMP_023997 [Pampus punctatissimus]